MDNHQKELEAQKSLAEAEARFKANDLAGALRKAFTARSLLPSLPNLSQSLTAYCVHLAATKTPKTKQPTAECWHAILGSKPSDDVSKLKRRYKKMCILVHPDKCRSAAADGAFKLVSDAWKALAATAPKKPSKTAETRRKTATPPPRPNPNPNPSPSIPSASCPQCKAKVHFLDQPYCLAIACRNCDMISVRKDGKSKEFQVEIRMRGGRFFTGHRNCTATMSGVTASFRVSGIDVENVTTKNVTYGCDVHSMVNCDGVNIHFSRLRRGGD